MAWTNTGKTNLQLITNMSVNKIVQSERVIAAFKKVDRVNYVPEKGDAYIDSPQSIGYGATISAPHMHGYAAENLLPFLNPGAKVLDIGSGSGYLCAVFHHLVSSDGSKGKVVGVDHIPELVDMSVKNLKADGLSGALESGDIEMIAGDGREGWSKGGPYNAIHVGAAAPVIPKKLIEQLATPGRMFIPVGEHSQNVLQIDKSKDGAVSEKELFSVLYVPLTDRKAQWKY